MSDLRKAAQQALGALEKMVDEVDDYFVTATAAIESLRAALAQPEQEPYTSDVTRIMRDAGMTFHLGLPHKAVIKQMTRVVDLVYAEASIKATQQFAAALAQPEQLVVDGDDLPTLTKWTPMAEYAAMSAAVPGRAEALKQAGYTRRPRQLPKEDEQEPVAWINEHGHIDGGLDAILDPTGWTPLYAAPPQRKPLTQEELETAYRAIWRNLPDDFNYGAYGWIEQGIRYAEKAHGIE